MNKDLKIQVLLSAVDKLTEPFRNATKSVQKTVNTLKEHQNKLRALKTEYNTNEAQIRKYAQAINPLTAKLSEQNVKVEKSVAEVKRLELAMKNIHNPTRKFVNKLERAKQKLAKLRTEQGQTEIKLKTLRSEFERSGFNTQEMANKQSRLRRNMRETNGEIDKQRAKLQQLNQIKSEKVRYNQKVEHLRNRSEKLASVGQRAFAQSTAMGYGLSTPISQFMEFEDAMAGVARQVTGLKDESGQFTAEYDQMAQKIQEMSKRLPMATTDIANMVTAGARMEIPKERLAEFVTLSTQMATAFDVENVEGFAETFGKVQKNFQLTIEQGKELADVINYLDDSAISKGTDIIDFLNNTSGIAGIVNIDHKNLAALGSTLLTAGNEASTSAKAVESTFNRLAKAPDMKPVRNALAQLGLDAKKIQKGMVVDAEGTLLQVIDKIKTLPKHLQAGVITGIAGGNYNTQMASLVSNTQEYRQQIALANSEEAKGSMEREFQTRMSTLSAKWQIFKNQLFNSSSTFGKAMKQSLMDMMDRLSNLLDRVNAWVNANPELTAQLGNLAIYGTATLGVFGLLASTLSFLLYPVFRLMLAFSKYTGVMKIFEKANHNVVKSLFQVKNSVPMIKGLLNGVGSAFKLVGRTIWTFLKLIWNPMNYVRAVLLGLNFTFLALISPIGILVALLTVLGALIVSNWQTIKAFFNGFIEGFSQASEPLKQAFAPLAPLFDIISSAIGKVWQWIKDLFTPTKQSAETLQEAANWGKKFGEWTAAALNLALTPLKMIIDGVSWLINNIGNLSFDGLLEKSKSIIGGVKQDITTLWDKTKAFSGNTSNQYSTSAANTAVLVAQNATQGFSNGGYTGNGNARGNCCTGRTHQG